MDIHKGKGYGFTDEKGGIYLVRCFECGKENYAPQVATGRCAWCGFDANKKEDIEVTKAKYAKALKECLTSAIEGFGDDMDDFTGEYIAEENISDEVADVLEGSVTYEVIVKIDGKVV